MKPLARISTFFLMLVMLFSLAIGGASASDAEQSFQQPMLVVNTSFLNVRTGPGVEYTVLVTVVGGTELPVLGLHSDGVWYQVNTDAGPGWVNIEFTLPRGDFTNLPLLAVGETGAPNANLGQGGGGESSEVRTTTPVLGGNTVVINTSFLNLRSGPSASYSVIATVSGGTELVVLGRAEDNVWLLVEGDFGQAWLNSEFTLFRGNYATVSTVGSDGVVPNLGQGGGTVVTGRSVTGVSLTGKDMHAAPSYESAIINRNVPNDFDTVYPLLAAQVDAEGNTWYLVDLPGFGQGWMDHVLFRALQCGADSVGVINTEAPIVFDGISATDSYLLSVGTEFYILGYRNDLVLVELLDGTVGLIQDFVIFRREGVEFVCTGATSTVSAQTSGSTTTAPVAQVSGNHIVVNTGNLNVRSGPNASFSVVATVPGATELAVVGRADDGVWYYVEGSFGRGWVNSEFVLFRGDYGSVPVVDLSGS
ncbi:MAG: hypothetical protein Phog2KO_16570 [Phototrophicaceae bacterium]